MGTTVAYRCSGCAFETGALSVGWGRAGRGRFWGVLGHCAGCKTLTVVDLADVRPEERDHRCKTCNGLMKLLEGIAVNVPCPRCGATLERGPLSSWT